CPSAVPGLRGPGPPLARPPPAAPPAPPPPRNRPAPHPGQTRPPRSPVHPALPGEAGQGRRTCTDRDPDAEHVLAGALRGRPRLPGLTSGRRAATTAFTGSANAGVWWIIGWIGGGGALRAG